MGKKKKVKERKVSPKMYVGPTIPGLGIQNRVYSDIPNDAREVIESHPKLSNLFINVRDYPKANLGLRNKSGYIYSAYEAALNLKGGK